LTDISTRKDSGNNADFYQKRIFLDTAPLIYFIEGHSTYQDKLMAYFTSNDNEDFTFITSSIALLEVLVKPLKEGKSKLVTQYKIRFL
jgi:predicted nucleic acid-binding protein